MKAVRPPAAAMCLVAVLLAAATAAVEVPPALALLLDARDDQVVDRVAVPSAERKVGEVRIVHRAGADVVQTLLATKLLKRAVAEIRRKELANWPPGRDGHAAAARYVAALEEVRTALAEREPLFDRSQDRRLDMLIEFVLGDRAAAVAIGTFAMKERDGTMHVTRREPMVVLELSRAYVSRNMRLIVADSFRLDGAALDARLAPLGRVRGYTPSAPR